MKVACISALRTLVTGAKVALITGHHALADLLALNSYFLFFGSAGFLRTIPNQGLLASLFAFFSARGWLAFTGAWALL
jgi:hypothetical protein